MVSENGRIAVHLALGLTLVAASSWLSQGVQDSPYSLPQAWLGRLHVWELLAMLGGQWGGALLASWLVRALCLG